MALVILQENFVLFKLSVNQSDDILMQITLPYFVTSAIIQLYHRLMKKTQAPPPPIHTLFKFTNGFAANF